MRRLALTAALALLVLLAAVVILNERRLANQRPTPSPVTEANGDVLFDPAAPVDTDADSCANDLVANDLPRFLSIPAAGVNKACIKSVGFANVTGPDGALSRQIQTASNIHHVGWYNQSSKPGTSGVTFLSGHSSPLYSDAVFNQLGHLKIGDQIQLERGDHKILYYEVFEVTVKPLAEANEYMSTLLTSFETASLSIVTCSGRWLDAERTMADRTMIRAKLTRIE
jgi:LPXTG-site transpeptidase (sortase) family protein